MRPRDVMQEIDHAFDSGDNIYLQGKPGIGKTEMPKQYAEEHGLGFVRIVMPQYEEVDLRGIPEVNENKRTVFYPTEELPYVDKHGEKGILLWDEHPSAKPGVQIISHQVLDSRKLGSLYTLPDGWINVLTGNRADDYAFVFEMPTTVRTRCAMYTVETSFEDWKKWALDVGKITPEILAFLNNNPGEFDLFTPDKPVTNHAIPRTWHKMSNYMKVLKSKGSTPSLESVIARVGEAAGNKFYGWHKIWKEVPNIDDILEGKGANVPKKIDIQWCVTSAILSKLVAAEKDKAVVQRCRNGFGYVNDLSSDIVMAFLNDIMNTRFWASVKKKVVTSPEWVALSKKHAKTIVGDVE